MKIPITDKFLLDLYNFIEDTSEGIPSILTARTMSQAHPSKYFKMKRKYESEKRKKSFASFVDYLKKSGYIKVNEIKANKAILLTKKGTEKAFIIKLKNSKRRKRKDGKLMMIIFDIPENKRKLRSMLRDYLDILDYQLIQKSVWVCAYDVEKETQEFLDVYSLNEYVKVFLIEKI